MVAGKRGRPSEYTPEIAAHICIEIASGLSLRKVCEPDEMPAESTVRLWVVEDREGFSAHYESACKTRAMLWADQILEIADEKGKDTNRSRLQVDTRKWLLSKVLPKVYGDKVTQVHEGGDKPVVVETIFSPVEMRERMARILRGTMTESDDRADPGDNPRDDQAKGP